jgi:aryl-alcohol dehydrogenase-like predicted oxidoreductase
VRCRKLVRGASTWSKLGFGASRCSIGVEENEASLRKAVLGGISLVDTSPMYGNAFGKSEQMVGKVLGKLQTQAHPTVMTKVGYSAANGDKIPAGAIEMAPGVVHCLEPDFSLQSFRESCARLGPVVPDYILVQNPETQASHALARLLEGKDSEAKEVDPAAVTEAWESTYSKLSLLFAALEELVASGDLLCGYGVSSLGLSEPDSSPMRVCHEQLLKCARNAAGDSHHLGVVQLPGNLLELDGLARAPVMQQAGLKVVVARPLTAVTNSGALSLVGGIFQSDPSQQYMDSCRDALEHFTMPPPEGRRPTPEEEETLKVGIIKEFLRGLLHVQS